MPRTFTPFLCRCKKLYKIYTPYIRLLTHKQLSFYFYVYFEGSTLAEQPWGVMLGELPPFVINIGCVWSVLKI